MHKSVNARNFCKKRWGFNGHYRDHGNILYDDMLQTKKSSESSSLNVHHKKATISIWKKSTQFVVTIVERTHLLRRVLHVQDTNR